MNNTKLALAFFLLLVTFFSACTKLGPDYAHHNKQSLPKAWDTNSTQSESTTKEWWKIFDDETLDLLIEKAYSQNLDLRSAGVRILQARAALGISEGLTYPQQQALSGSLAGVRQNAINFSAINTQFDLAWEMDVWGKYARNIESTEASLYASVASYEHILVSIIAEVARNYINYTTAQERIAFAKGNIAIQERVAQMTKVQFNAGNVSELDMQQAKTQLYATQSAIPSLELSMIQSRNALAVLLGLLPSQIDSLLKKTKHKKKVSPLKYANIISYIPQADLNADFRVNATLLSRRPDIQIAELQAKAQNARIGSAQVELYPHFTLFGSLGISSNNALNGWRSFGDSISVSAGPAFTWNIFQYGRIKNQVRIEDAKFQESLNNYNKTVLQAVSEISNALDGYALNKQQLELNKKTISASSRAYEISMIQYQDGMVDYQRLLSSVENLIRSGDAYALSKGNIALQIVFLYKALGGGWQISQGNSYLHKQDLQKMDKRSDWGEYLKDENIKLPKEADYE